MSETQKDDRISVYEIGYLLAGLPEEKVSGEGAAISGLITKSGGSIVTEEAPKNERLAYTMRKKTVSGSYDKYDSAYFGWIKFEMASSGVDALKKQIETLPNVLRILVITTVKENTYLGKHAPLITTGYTRKPTALGETEAAPAEKKEAAPATIEEMDKSIDDMVKEV